MLRRPGRAPQGALYSNYKGGVGPFRPARPGRGGVWLELGAAERGGGRVHRARPPPASLRRAARDREGKGRGRRDQRRPKSGAKTPGQRERPRRTPRPWRDGKERTQGSGAEEEPIPARSWGLTHLRNINLVIVVLAVLLPHRASVYPLCKLGTQFTFYKDVHLTLWHLLLWVPV